MNNMNFARKTERFDHWKVCRHHLGLATVYDTCGVHHKLHVYTLYAYGILFNGWLKIQTVYVRPM